MTESTIALDPNDEWTPENVKRGRDRIAALICNRDYELLFTEACCLFYALALQEKLGMPAYYECNPGTDKLRHVFVMNGKTQCYDYEGPKDISAIAEKYGGWRDVPPTPLTAERARKDICKRELGDLEASILNLARSEFLGRRALYPQ